MEQVRRTNCLTRSAIAVTLLSAIGCSEPPDMRDQRLVELAQQSIEQQAQQNELLARQSQAVVEESHQLAEASKELVARDAEARREMVVAQHELNAQLHQQRLAIDAGRDELEQERRQITRQRQRDPIVATSIQSVGLLLACLLPLVVCLYLIHQLSRHGPDDAAVAELLTSELLSEQPSLLPGPPLLPAQGQHAVRELTNESPCDERPTDTDYPF